MPGDAIRVKRLGIDQLHMTRVLRQDIELDDIRSEEEDFQQKELLRDQCGVQLGFHVGDALIGAIRLVPMDRRITLLESLLTRENVPDSRWRGSWEVGRLALSPEHRGITMLVRCLSDTASWLHENTEIESMFGICPAELAVIYSRFGFKVFKEVQIGRGQRRFSIILGQLKEIVAYFEARPKASPGGPASG